jgi:predicted HTH domain antitoxin
METKEVCFELPLAAFSALKKTPNEFARDMRVAAAAKWYEVGLVSQERAAEIAGLCREDFLMELSKFNVSPFQYSAEEVLREGCSAA